nr:hypothetical protein [Tanacetum cinerariifolium]
MATGVPKILVQCFSYSHWSNQTTAFGKVTGILTYGKRIDHLISEIGNHYAGIKRSNQDSVVLQCRRCHPGQNHSHGRTNQQ